MQTFPPRSDTVAALVAVNDLYRDHLHRPVNENLHIDLEGLGVWTQYYLEQRLSGREHDAALDATRREIWRVAPETQGHPNPWDPAPVPPPDGDLFPIDPDVAWNVRGDFLGRWTDPAGPVFMFAGMDVSRRAEQITWMTAQGYTATPIAIHNDYPAFPQWHYDYWDRPAELAGRLQELLAARIRPILVVHPRRGTADTIDQHLDRVRKVWPVLQPVSPLVMWGWEINDLGGRWSDGDDLLDYLAALWRIVSPTPIGVHFTPERWSGWPAFDHSDDHDPTGKKGEIAWLLKARDFGASALLYQDWPAKPLREGDPRDGKGVLDRALDLTSPHGWSGGIAGRVVDGAGLVFVMAEFARDTRRHRQAEPGLLADARCRGRFL